LIVRCWWKPGSDVAGDAEGGTPQPQARRCVEVMEVEGMGEAD